MNNNRIHFLYLKQIYKSEYMNKIILLWICCCMLVLIILVVSSYFIYKYIINPDKPDRESQLILNKQEAISEQARLAELTKQGEQTRLAELAKQGEQTRLAELAKQGEQARLAELAKQGEQARLDELAKQVQIPINQIFPTPDFIQLQDITYLPPDEHNLENAVTIIYQSNFKFDSILRKIVATNYILTLENGKLIWKNATTAQNNYYPQNKTFNTLADGSKEIIPSLIPSIKLFDNQTFFISKNNCAVKCTGLKSATSTCIQDLSIVQDPECYSTREEKYMRCYTLMMNTNKGPLAVTYKPDDPNKTAYEITTNSNNDALLNVPGKLILEQYNPNNTWQTIKETFDINLFPTNIALNPLLKYSVNLQLNDHITMPVIQQVSASKIYCPQHMILSVNKTSSSTDPSGWNVVFSNKEDTSVALSRTFIVQPLTQ
jgi:uncharacterized protein YxeA